MKLLSYGKTKKNLRGSFLLQRSRNVFDLDRNIQWANKEFHRVTEKFNEGDGGSMTTYN